MQNFTKNSAELFAGKQGSFNVFFTMLAVALVFALMAAPELAQAGTGGAEFNSVWTTLTNWIEGTLGKIASGAMVLVGIIAGIARQSLMAFGIGIGSAIGLYNTPTVIDNLLTATAEHMPAAQTAIMQLSNGLGM